MLTVILQNRIGYENKSVTLARPATQGDINEALADLDAEGIDEIQIVNYESRISAIQHFEGTDLAELDNLATMISRMDDDTYLKFMAVAGYQKLHEVPYDMSCYSEVGVLSRLAYRLDDYDFLPGVRPEDIGRLGLVRSAGRQQPMAPRLEAEEGTGLWPAPGGR